MGLGVYRFGFRGLGFRDLGLGLRGPDPLKDPNMEPQQYELITNVNFGLQKGVVLELNQPERNNKKGVDLR